jgi:Carboxypeptidase regulatory-like domain
MPIRKISIFIVALILFTPLASAQQSEPLTAQDGTIIGTVLDMNGGVVPSASVSLQGVASRRTTMANGNGLFSFNRVQPGLAYQIDIRAPYFATWISKTLILSPGQFYIVPHIRLQLETVAVSVTAVTPEQLATEEVHAEEHQRVFGVIPNFYVVYERDAVPLTAKLKFRLAIRALIDPVTVAGFALNAGFYQMGHYPNYQEGWKGYGQRLGATFAGGYTNVLVGDALLPAVLHQDPRYFYQGTGTKHSRLLHALSNAFIARGDNGRLEFNYSGILGDLSSGAVANAYYPVSDRGAGLVVSSALIGMGGRMANGVVQEFLLRRVTANSGERHDLSAREH